MSKRMILVIVAMAIAFAVNSMAATPPPYNMDVTSVGNVSGSVSLNAYSYADASRTMLGAHHSFDAWGNFDFNVGFQSADSGQNGGGAGLGNMNMTIPKAESIGSTYAGFQAVWTQNFTTTSYGSGGAGVFGLYAEGTGGASMNVKRGTKPYHRHIQISGNNGDYKPITAEGSTGDLDQVLAGDQSYIAKSWLESYASYSDIGTTPPTAPTDYSSILVEGTGGKAQIGFAGKYPSGYASVVGVGSVKHDGNSWVNVDAGTGFYMRSVGGDTSLASELYSAPGGGSWTASGTFSSGMTANPWTTAN